MTTKKHIPNSNSVNPIHVQRYTFQYIFLLKSVQKWKSEKDPKKKQISRPQLIPLVKLKYFFFSLDHSFHVHFQFFNCLGEPFNQQPLKPMFNRRKFQYIMQKANIKPLLILLKAIYIQRFGEKFQLLYIIGKQNKMLSSTRTTVIFEKHYKRPVRRHVMSVISDIFRQELD